MFISSPCRHQSTRDILSDKSHVSYMKGRGLDLSEYDEYDDEYDDTYDSQNVGATDQDSADELLAVKRLVCYIHFIIVHIALIIFTCMHTVQTCSYTAKMNSFHKLACIPFLDCCYVMGDKSLYSYSYMGVCII